MATVPHSDRASRVLVIYTGGTIGMMPSERGFVPAKGYMAEKLRTLPQFHSDAAAAEGSTTHAMPKSGHGVVVGYDILEYDPLLDSCNLSDADWRRITNDVQQHYGDYDAFVVLHGTDTMAYTASALSFMLGDGLAKTVVVTGSQIPISQPRNDGMANLEGALYIAGHYTIPEALLYFNNKLLRGNRAVKCDASRLAAFTAPNHPEIASVAITVDVNWHLVRPTPAVAFSPQAVFDGDVATVQLFPGLTPEALRRQLAPPLKGVVLRTYGAGNAPDGNAAFLAVLKEASDRGLVIVNITQCWHGMVEGHYATGVALREAGVIAGRDMTPEAALVKLGWLLGQGLPASEVAAMMQRDLRGELTQASEAVFSLKDSSFLRAVYTTLKEQRERQGTAGPTCEFQLLQDALLPTLLCSTAHVGDTAELAAMVRDGVDLNAADYDGRTALHLAAAGGKVDSVKLLLGSKEASKLDVNARDRYGHTPLWDAVSAKEDVCTQLLVAAGAQLLVEEEEWATTCLALASKNDAVGVERWLKAGADPTVTDYDKRTALHVAASTGRLDVVRVLLRHLAAAGVCEEALNAVDVHGATPLRDALDHGCDECAAAIHGAGGRIGLPAAQLSARLCRFAHANSVAALERYLRHGAEVDTADYDHRTALHVAAAEGHVDSVRLLLRYKASTAAKDRWGNTAHAEAASHGASDGVLALLKA